MLQLATHVEFLTTIKNEDVQVVQVDELTHGSQLALQEVSHLRFSNKKVGEQSVQVVALLQSSHSDAVQAVHFEVAS